MQSSFASSTNLEGMQNAAFSFPAHFKVHFRTDHRFLHLLVSPLALFRVQFPDFLRAGSSCPPSPCLRQPPLSLKNLLLIAQPNPDLVTQQLPFPADTA